MSADADDLERAYHRLKAGDDTVVACLGDQMLTSPGRGVAPLVDWLSAGVDLTGFAVADRVVGRAAALLYSLAGVGAVHALLASQPGLDVLSRSGIAGRADTVVPRILNRDRSAGCPLEAAVAGIDDPGQALVALRQRLNQLRAGHD